MRQCDLIERVLGIGGNAMNKMSGVRMAFLDFIAKMDCKKVNKMTSFPAVVI